MGSEEKVVTAGSEMQLVAVDNHKNNNHDHDHYDYCDDYDDNENVDYESTLFWNWIGVPGERHNQSTSLCLLVILFTKQDMKINWKSTFAGIMTSVW